MNLQNVQRAYFLGIGGIGMSAIARYLKMQGAYVSGYDKTPSDLTDQLIAEGIAVHFNEEQSNFDTEADLYIYTPAIPQDHPYFNLVPIQHQWHKRSEVLQWITDHTKTIAVSGTHGKTTTSAFLTHILYQVHGQSSGFVGGVMSNYNSNLIAAPDSEYIVVEADEFDKSFLKLNPEIALITSLDPDHLDIYGSFDAMKKDYQAFASLTKTLVVNKRLLDDFKEVNHSYSALSNSNNGYEGANIRVVDSQFRFEVNHNGEHLGVFTSQLPGRHNVENAVAAISIAHILGLSMEEVAKAVGSFKGVHRRFDRVLENAHVRLIDDYAHHPTEIKAAISAAKELYPNTKITVIFQPHLYSRTRDLEDGFVESLSEADVVILLPIYPAREKPIDGVSSANLLKKLSLKTKHLVEKSHLGKAVLSLSPETVIVLGAGDIDRSVKPLAKLLENWKPDVE